LNKKLALLIVVIGLIAGLSFSHMGQIGQTKYEKIKNLKLEIKYYGKYLITITELNEVRMTNGKDYTEIFLIRESEDPWFLAVHVEKLDKSSLPLYVYIRYLNGTLLESGYTDKPEGTVNINFTIK
jgi:hypothetical protein